MSRTAAVHRTHTPQRRSPGRAAPIASSRDTPLRPAHFSRSACACGGGCPRCIQRKAWVAGQPLTVDEAYKKTVRASWGEKAVKRLVELQSDSADHRFASWGELVAEYDRAKKAPDPPKEKEPNVCMALPGFSQRGPSCAAASLITPVLIWDKEQYRAGDPNPRLRNMVANMKRYMEKNEKTVKPNFEAAQAGAYANALKQLALLDEAAADENYKMTELTYQSLALILMRMSQKTTVPGLDTPEMITARESLGFPGKTTMAMTFEEFFTDTGDLAKMKEGQMAQLTWVLKPEKPPADGKYPVHAFTIGRLKDGTWIMNDQGYPLCLQGATLEALKARMVAASKDGTWGGVTDNEHHATERDVTTGYTVLGDEKTAAP